eukprot:198633-Amphidinium_carterae.1
MEELQEKECEELDQTGGDEQRKQQEQIKKVKKRCLMKEQSIVKAMQQVRREVMLRRSWC